MKPELNTPSQEEVNAALWAAGESFRGLLNSARHKKLFLSFLFFKYLNDTAGSPHSGNVIIPEKCSLEYIRKHKNSLDLGGIINRAMEKIAGENPLLENIFAGADFCSESLGPVRERNRRLRKLISDLSKPAADFHILQDQDFSIIGRAFSYLLERFASNAGKKGGEHYTPEEVNGLLVQLLDPQPGETICDPVFGSGSLLTKLALHAGQAAGTEPHFYGQDIDTENRNIARMNLFMNGMTDFSLVNADCIRKPAFREGDGLKKFDLVAGNPPFSVENFNAKEGARDVYQRFRRGLPPQTKGNYAFILHMLETAKEEGRVGVIVPHGVLFRLGTEKQIRENIVRENLLEAVIGLPPNLFFGTGIATAILLFRKNREHQDVLFIDATRGVENGKKQNKMRSQHIDRIIEVYRGFLAGGGSLDKYSRRATATEIERNEFNLSISRYVDTSEKKKRTDIYAIQKRMDELEKEMSRARSEMNRYLKELDFQ